MYILHNLNLIGIWLRLKENKAFSEKEGVFSDNFEKEKSAPDYLANDGKSWFKNKLIDYL